jgi:arabinogalactan oligomer/maltooligosaccharide transport system substrate-binding protein
MPSKYQYNFCFDVGNGWYQQSLFFSNGCTIFGENGNDASKGIEPRDKGLQAAQVMFNMNKDSKIQTGDAQPAVGITAAAGVTGTWAAADIKAAITAKGGTYACTVLPKLTFGTEQKTWQSVRDFKHVGVNAVTKNPELACKLAAFIANKDSQLLRYNLKTTAPTNSETLADPSITWDEAIIAQSQQTGSLSNTFLQPTIYGNQNYWTLSGSFNSDLVAAKEAEIADYFDAFNDQLTTAE